MLTVSGGNRPRNRRSLLLVIVLLTALSGAWGSHTPTASAAADRVAHGQWSVAVGSQTLTTAQSSQAGPADTPVPASSDVSSGRFRYFYQTAHFLRGPFLAYWESHGATPVFGLPVTEALNEEGLIVQYLERARFEWHPENPDPRNQVLLSRLGVIMTESRGLMFDSLPGGENTPVSAFFPETGHNLANAFLTYWLHNGGLAVFGYPISEEIAETSPTDGKTYTVQYFERNRFEWHPENPPAYNVQLGLLGIEYAHLVSLNPLARVLLPAPIPQASQDLSDSPQLAKLVEAGLLPAVRALGHTPQFRWVPAVLIQNNIPVQFADINEEGVAGAFMTTRNRSRPYLIVVPAGETGEPVAALASVLAHEATHAYDVTTGVSSTRLQCSIEEELRAYMNGLAAWVLIEGDNALSQSYEPGSLSDAVNRSVKAFNSQKPQLDVDFSPQKGRQFLRDIYGSDCGA
ncbi:MAG: hypothetical protein ACJ78Q_15495 [Chloroflexia bacterium]